MINVGSEIPLPSCSGLSQLLEFPSPPFVSPHVLSNKHLSKNEQIWNKGEHHLMPTSIILMRGGVSRPHNEMQVIKDIKWIPWLPGLFTPKRHEYA